MKVEKGIKVILNCLNTLDDNNIQVDFYGPATDKNLISLINCNHNAFYKGCVNSVDVCKILSCYNALLLPTFWSGEGYPGIIIESYSVGLPVITTNWMQIPEIVNESCGFLIEPKNHIQLAGVLASLNVDHIDYLRAGSLKQFQLFNTDYVHSKYFNMIFKL